MGGDGSDDIAVLLLYYARLLERHGLDVYLLALLSYRGRKSQSDRCQVDFPGFQPLAFRFQVIQLNALKWRDYVGRPNPVGACMLPFMGRGQGKRAQVKASAFKMLVGLNLEQSRLGFLFQFVDSYLPLARPKEKRQFDAEIMLMSQKERELVLQYTTSWEQDGLARGREVGRQEGLRGAAELLIRDRFQVEARALLESLQSVQDERLHAIVLALGRQAQLDELRALLG